MTVPAKISVDQAAVAPARHAASVFGPLQREIDRLFEDFSPSLLGRAGDAGCKMDLADTGQGLELTIELPGLEEKDVDVSVADGVLTVSGEKKFETDKTDKNYRFVERRYGSFSRSLTLPEGAKADQIKATLNKGVLKVTIPAPAPSAPEKIAVQAVA
jgi:HSP20 family protein